VADIYFANAVKLCISYTLGKDERARYPNVVRHFETVYNVPEIKDVFGKADYLEKMPVFTPPKKDKPAAETKSKEPKADKPKEPKAEKKPKPDDDDDDIDLVPEEPKAKNPLDLLPKSTFNLEDWKRAYSNMDTRGPGGSIEWFYKKCENACSDDVPSC
jgi:elongation factor 1-gamma